MPPLLELQEVMSPLSWVLGTQSGPLEGKYLLLTAEPSLYSWVVFNKVWSHKTSGCRDITSGNVKCMQIFKASFTFLKKKRPYSIAILLLCSPRELKTSILKVSIDTVLELFIQAKLFQHGMERSSQDPTSPSWGAMDNWWLLGKGESVFFHSMAPGRLPLLQEMVPQHVHVVST